MRSMSLPAFLVSALAALSLATGCKSSESTAKTGQAGESASSAEGDESADPAPVLPVPRRMRGSESGDGTAGEAEPGRGRFGGPRGEEMRQRLQEARKRFDTDGDGRLNEDERAAMRHDRLQRRIERVDSNGDGKISRDEAEASPAGGRWLRDFASADANQDSFISPEELEAVMSERQSRRTESFRQRREEGGAEPAPPTPE